MAINSMTDEDLPAREAARARRRDRDMEAEGQALMRPGMAKVFRQVTDAAAKPPTPKQRKAKRAKKDVNKGASKNAKQE
jgi:hypothetical protein